MEPAEYLELIEIAIDAAGVHAMNVVTVLISYLVAGYLVGSKLTRLQIGLLTVVYSIFYVFPTVGAVGTLRRAMTYVEGFIEEYPALALSYVDPPFDGFHYILLSVFIFGWAVSVIFVISIYRQSTRDT